VRGAEMSRRVGPLICAALLILSAGSMTSYFRKADFLNKAYLLPYQEIADVVNRQSAGKRAILLADAWNSDPAPLAALVNKDVRFAVIGHNSLEGALAGTPAATEPAVVWSFRNTHDTSPGSLTTRLEREWSQGRKVRRHLFVPYDSRDRLLMRLLGWKDQPTHFVQLTEMRTIGGGASPK
jgi:hypothetical protein